jgi:hypothetical protein
VRQTLATLLIAALLPCVSQAESRRIPLKEFFFLPGGFFQMQEDLIAPAPEKEAFEAQALGGEPGVERLAKAIAGLPPDRLAEHYVRTADAYLVTNMRGQVLSGVFARIYMQPGEVSQRINTTPLEVDLPDGRNFMAPLPEAFAAHRGALRLNARRQAETLLVRRIDDRYLLARQGKCQLTEGQIELRQVGMLIEGWRDDRLLVVGAVGAREAWFIAAEPRFATITVNNPGDGISVDAPDRASEIYRAELGPPLLTLAGREHRDCSLLLTPEAE